MSSFMSPCFPSLNLRWSLPRSWTKRAFHIDYPLGSDNVSPDYHNNRAEEQKTRQPAVSAFCRQLFEPGVCPRLRLRITGRNLYRPNERLAGSRARVLASPYSNCGIPRSRIETTCGRRLEGLSGAFTVGAASAYADAASPPFPECQASSTAAKKQTDGAPGGAPLPDMLCHFFPRLRRLRSKCALDYPIA